MIRFRTIYKSFIPYLFLLGFLLVFILLLDNRAEKVTSSPQRINISAKDGLQNSGDNSWIYAESDSLLLGEDIFSDSLFLSARQNYRSDQWDQARETFTILTLKYKDNPVLLNYLGLIALKEREYGEAEEYFKSSLAVDSGYISSIINLAILCTRMQRYNEAESLYLQASSKSPLNPRIYYNLGFLYSRMESWEKADEAFLRSIYYSSGEQKAMAYCHFGYVRLQLLDTLGARQSFEQAILYKPDYELARIYYTMTLKTPETREAELLKIYRLNPRSYYANYHLGLLYSEEFYPAKSEMHLQNALDREPYDEKAIDALANLLIDQGRFEDARLVLSGLESEDTIPQYYFYQAKLAVRENNSDLAIRLYRKAIAKSSNEYPEANLNLALLYKQTNQIEKAIQCYQNALETREDYSKACYNLAVLYSEIDSSERAIQYYRQSIQMDPLSYKSFYNMGVLYRQMGKETDAEKAFINSLRIQPDYIKALMALGNLYLNQDDFDNAINTYHQLLSKYPNYSKGWFNLGLAFSRTDRIDDAINAYEKLIEIDPENVRARINLGVLHARQREYDLAAVIFVDAMDLDMSNPDIRFNLALQYERTGDLDKAKYQFLKAIEIDKNYLKAYEKLEELYSRSDDTIGLTIIAFHRLLLDPNPDSLYAIGRVLHEMEEIDYAMEAYLLAKEYGLQGKWIEYWIGKAHMDRFELNPAIQQFEKVLEFDDEHKFALYRLGQTFELLGRKQKADGYYDILRRLDPDFKIVHKSSLAGG